MISCPGKTVCDITISSLSTKYKMKFHLGNFFLFVFFLFFCNRMGLISVSGQKFNFSHRFCCIPIETKELAVQHDWDDYEFQDRTPNTDAQVSRGEWEGVCYVCFVGECQIQADVAHITLLSSVKLIFFCEKGLLLGLSKGDARVEIPASFVLTFNCKLQSSP